MLSQLFAILKSGGLAGLRAGVTRIIGSHLHGRDSYHLWVRRNTPSQGELESLRAKSAALPYKPVFSLLVSVSRTDEPFLGRCIRSIVDQTYPFWELCIIGLNSTEDFIEKTLRCFEIVEGRAKVLYRDRTDFCPSIESAVTGDFICIVDEDAIVAPEALGEFADHLNRHSDTDALYSDEDKIDAQGTRLRPFFKPDWSPEYLESFPYLSSLTCYRTSIVRKTGWFHTGAGLAVDYDLALRFTEATERIMHIPKVLYHGSLKDNGASNRGEDAINHVKSRLRRLGTPGAVAIGPFPDLFEVRRDIVGNPLISIIIPAGARRTAIRGADTVLLSNCIASIRNKSTYRNYEIIVVHDGNLDRATMGFAETNKCVLIAFEGTFNFSTKINLGARHALGEHLVFLNDDTEVISADWLQAMLQFSQRKEIGAVGAKLYYEDGTIQHVGVSLNRDGFPQHLYHGYPGSLPGYFYSLIGSRNCLAVTGACLMTRSDVFEKLGALNEEMAVNYNDVDYCLRAREAGYRIVFASKAELFHFESKSRPAMVTPGELDYFAQLWHAKVTHDPYYNINLEPDTCAFEMKIEP